MHTTGAMNGTHKARPPVDQLEPRGVASNQPEATLGPLSQRTPWCEVQSQALFCLVSYSNAQRRLEFGARPTRVVARPWRCWNQMVGVGGSV